MTTSQDKKQIIIDLHNKNPHLKPAEIEGILHQISEDKAVTLRDLRILTGLPLKTLQDFVASAHGVLQYRGNGIDLTNSLKKDTPKFLDHDWCLINYEDPEILDKLRLDRTDYNVKYKPKRDLDQFFAFPETTYAKAQLLFKKGLLQNMEVALLGDDDLVSLAIQYVEPPQKLTVFDIDTNILDFIEAKNSETETENTQTAHYDCFKEPERSFKDKFDVVMLDPPYTQNGVALFLKRALQLVKKGDNPSYIVLFFGTSPKTPEKTLEIQNIIDRFKLVIEDKIHNFAHYSGADSIGNSSSVYILRTTPQSSPNLYTAPKEKIYTNQVGKDRKFPYVEQYTAKLFEVPLALLNSKQNLVSAAKEFCKVHGLKIVDTKVTKFKNGGLSLTFVLSTSNLLLHTWPEKNALHIDLLVCSPVRNSHQLGESFTKIFKAKSFQLNRVE